MTWWDELWAGFGEWWLTIGWGDAPGWVGAVLTSGSLFLAIYILGSDKRAARQAEVKKLIISSRLLTTFDSAAFEVSVYNANEHPLPLVFLKYWDGFVWQNKLFVNQSFSPDIAPGGTGVVSIPWGFPGNLNSFVKDKNILLLFTDSLGNEWYRGLDSRKIRSKWLVNRWLKRGRWARFKEGMKSVAAAVVNWFKPSPKT